MGLRNSKHLKCDPAWSPERVQLELEKKMANLKLKICRYEKRRRTHDVETALEYRRVVIQIQQLLEAIYLAQTINKLNHTIDSLDGENKFPTHHQLIVLSTSMKDANDALSRFNPETISWLSKTGILHMTSVPQKKAPPAHPLPEHLYTVA